MANKEFWPGTLATALAFGLLLAGCDPDLDSDDSGGRKDQAYANRKNTGWQYASSPEVTVPAGTAFKEAAL
jgi:hypothetical protein